MFCHPATKIRYLAANKKGTEVRLIFIGVKGYKLAGNITGCRRSGKYRTAFTCHQEISSLLSGEKLIYQKNYSNGLNLGFMF
jgi:hypothetical protein